MTSYDRPFNCWHYEIDTLPHFSEPVTDEAGRLLMTLWIPIGVWVPQAERPLAVNVIFDIQVDGRSFRIGFHKDDPNGHVRTITPARIAHERFEHPKKARWHVEMKDRLQCGNQYYEAVLKRVPVNSCIKYRVTVVPCQPGPRKGRNAPRKGKEVRRLGPYTLYAVNPPKFEAEDVFFASDGQVESRPRCVLLHKSDKNFHYFRADFEDISTSRLPFDLQVDDCRVTLASTPFAPCGQRPLPFIDPIFDTVLAVFPNAGPIKNVMWHGAPLDMKKREGNICTRVMFIHYCMQGLNDLFERGNQSYRPPRTYMKTTMRDEDATYSSRPNSFETAGVGDGYSYTLDAHRRNGIKYLWTFNGGVLALLAHDCPEDVARIQEDIESGLLDPTIAGFGGHRLPYYQLETNRYSIKLGTDIMREVIGRHNDVFYLDQRLYKQLPNVMRALASEGIKYIVVDASTGFAPYWATCVTNLNAPLALEDPEYRRKEGHQYLWQDQKTGLYLLFINDELRENMVFSTDAEMERGKLAGCLRKRFLDFATNPGKRDRHLLIYSDDADKASGNGWFDGDYAKEIPFTEVYAAALEWIAAHPWIVAITSADLRPERDCVGSMNMQTATCPSVDPGGITTCDQYDKKLHFDEWYDCWKGFRAVWLDKTLEELSQAAEYAIIDWRAEWRNQLYELAQMQFSMALHESQWNKQPLENGTANLRMDVNEPEDFVVAASLQIRNTHVYLAASAWAEWTRSSHGSATVVDDGPLVGLLEAAHYRDETRIFGDAFHLDQDPLRNVLLYNREVLVVIDRNGGRITYVFVMRNGEPVCVSGTPKCWQFLTEDLIPCDGEVLQNTVYTPNHAFVACDVKQARGTEGRKLDKRKQGNWENLPCWYPDNFNEYAVGIGKDYVDLSYVRMGGTAPVIDDIGMFQTLLTIDRTQRMRGGTGVVFHPDSPFKKRITLTGRTIRIEYVDVQEDHVVANELCFDVRRALLHGERQEVKANGKSIQVRGPNVAGPAVRCLSNCVFTEETLGGITPATAPKGKSLRLHRVMTDCFEVMASKGGNFAYELEV